MLTYNPRDRHNTNWQVANKDEIFSVKEIKKIQSIAKKIPEQKGGTGFNGQESSQRKSDIRWLQANNKEFRWIFDKVASEIMALNNSCWNYDLYGFEVIQYTTYKSGDFYNWHMDAHLGPSRNAEPPRKLSATILLNDDFDGGQFQFFNGDDNHISLEMKPGTIIVFPSFMFHRVAPVTSGVRNSLVTWVLGPKFK